MNAVEALTAGLRAMTAWCVDQNKKDIHTCPHCNAGVSGMILITGGVHRSRNRYVGKMQILCTGCNKRHTYKGLDRKATELYLQLINNTRGVQRQRMMKGQYIFDPVEA